MEEMDPVVNEVDVGEVTIDQPRWYEGHISLEDAKTFIKANITTAARSFIAIGFYLKCVRDRELFTEDGFQNVWDFAKEEYGISKSTASRYMSMNDRFSEKGNSPNICEEYRAFGKSQLQEMLYLEDDQLDQIKPGDRVEDIRSLRKPKEVPYIELPGQLDFEIDFPDILPDPPEPPALSQKQTFEMNVEDMLSGEDQDGIAISQQGSEEEVQKTQPKAFTGYYNPDDEKEVDESYSMANIPRASDRHVTMFARLFVQENVGLLFHGGVFYEISDEEIIRMLKLGYHARKENPIMIDNDVEVSVGAEIIEFSRGSEDLGICLFQKFANYVHIQINEYISKKAEEQGENQDQTDSESEEPGGAPEPYQTVIDGEFEEILPEQSVQSVFEEEKAELHNWIKVYQDEGLEMPPMVERQKIIVAALACAVEELERLESEPKPAKQEQPELPILKNNEQRAAFIDAYEKWPIWIETKETEERYYRYDLSGKVAMVIKVSWKHSWASYRESKDYEYGAEQYYLLGVKSEWRSGKSAYVEDDARTFYECNTNRSALVEYLKEFQRKK